jgi:hypothetical protein
LNFDQAISAHLAWRLKFTSYLQRPDGSLDPVEVGAETRCDLGKWIAGDGLKFFKLPEFRKLKIEHARFHRAAAELVDRANRGENVAPEVELGARSEFVFASTAIVLAIKGMKAKSSSIASPDIRFAGTSND